MVDKYKPKIFLEGQKVYAKNEPDVQLTVRRYLHDVYYCRLISDPKKELVYFEREIAACD